MLDAAALDSFERDGWAVLPAFLDAHQIADIQAHLHQLQREQQLKRAGIGKGNALQVVNEQRGDYIVWLDAQEVPSALQPYFQGMESLRSQLNRYFYLGLDELEAHLALYPKGAFYKKHSDRHQQGSKRVVSAVLYLNTTWETTDGGELVLDLENGTSEKIIPEAGKMVIFLSHLMHEVQVTQRDRMSITGWFLER
jgi:SM-20-related protein